MECLSSSSGTTQVQDGPPPHLVEPSRVCLFCYKTVISTCEEDVGRFLTLLGRFMGEEDALQMFCGGRERKGVGCCGECGSIVSSFSEAYHQLKCLELRLEWKLGTLVNVMRFANRVPARMEGVRRLILEGTGGSGGGRDWEEDGEMIGAELMDRKISNFKALRTKLIKTCARKLSRSQPRVHLERRVEVNHPDASFTSALVKTETLTVASASIKIDTTDPVPPPSILAECFLGWSMSLAAITMLASMTTQPEVRTRTTPLTPLPSEVLPLPQIDLLGPENREESWETATDVHDILDISQKNSTEGEGANGHGVFGQLKSGNGEPPLNSTLGAETFGSGCSAIGATNSNEAIPPVEESTDSMNPSEEMLRTEEEPSSATPAFELDNPQENLDFIPVSRNTIKAILRAVQFPSEVQSVPLIDLDSDNLEGSLGAVTDAHDTAIFSQNCGGGVAGHNVCGQGLSEAEAPFCSNPAEKESTPNSRNDNFSIEVVHEATLLVEEPLQPRNLNEETLGNHGGASPPQNLALAEEVPSDSISKSPAAPPDTKTEVIELPQNRRYSFQEKKKRSFMEMEEDRDLQDGHECHGPSNSNRSSSSYFSSNARPIKVSMITQPEVVTCSFKSSDKLQLSSPKKTSPPVAHLAEEEGRSPTRAGEFEAVPDPSMNVNENGAVVRTTSLPTKANSRHQIDLECEMREESLGALIDVQWMNRGGDASSDVCGQPESGNEEPTLNITLAAEISRNGSSAMGGTNEAILPVEKPTHSMNPSEKMLDTVEEPPTPASAFEPEDSTNSDSLHAEKLETSISSGDDDNSGAKDEAEVITISDDDDDDDKLRKQGRPAGTSENCDKDERVWCDLCSVTFFDGEQLQIHETAIHFNNRCPKCGVSFMPSSLLKIHMEQKHLECSKSTFFCGIGECRKWFRSEEALERHKKGCEGHHLGKEMLECDICEGIFLGKEKLDFHKRSAL